MARKLQLPNPNLNSSLYLTMVDWSRNAQTIGKKILDQATILDMTIGAKF